MKTLLDKALALTLLLSSTCFAATYEIPVGTMLDHSNVNNVGSIAWYFATYGPNNIYNLSSSATYYVRRTLTVPANSDLGEKVGVTAVIRADSNYWDAVNYNIMISLDGTNKRVRDLELHGDFLVKHLVYAGPGSDSPRLWGCTVHKSRKVHEAHLVKFDGTTNARIFKNMLRRAGCDSNEFDFSREASLICLVNSSNALIDENDIAYAASAGVTFNSSNHVDVVDNLIVSTGHALRAGYIADGITSYHAVDGTTYRDVWVTGNDIQNSYNHGIHLSGYDCHINGNTVRNSGMGSSYGSNIALTDWRDPVDCSAYCTIQNNSLLTAPVLGAPSINIGPYKSGTITVSGNTGYTGVSWGSTCN